MAGIVGTKASAIDSFPSPPPSVRVVRTTVFAVLSRRWLAAAASPRRPRPRRRRRATCCSHRQRPSPRRARARRRRAPKMCCRRLRICRRSGAPSRSSATRSAWSTRTWRACAAWWSSICPTAGHRACWTTWATAPCSPASRPIAATATASRCAGAAELPRALRHPAGAVGVARRFLEDAARACAGAFDTGGPARRRRDPRPGARRASRRSIAKHRARGQRLEAARAAAGAGRSAALAEKDARRAKEVNEHPRFESERAVFAEIEKRLDLRGPDGSRASTSPARTTRPCARRCWTSSRSTSSWTRPTSRRSTLEALARPPLANDFAALRRVLTERAMHAGGFLEDGSVEPADVRAVGADLPGRDGARHRVPDLASAAATRCWPAWASRPPRTRSRSSGATRAPTSAG